MAITYATDRIQVVGSKDSGTSSGSNTTTTLNDTSKSWTAGAYVGRTVWITGGTGAGQWRHITANTTNALTVHKAWNVTPGSNSTYAIGYNLKDVDDANVGTLTAQANNITETYQKYPFSGQYFIADILQIGDGTNATYFADFNFSLVVKAIRHRLKAKAIWGKQGLNRGDVSCQIKLYDKCADQDNAPNRTFVIDGDRTNDAEVYWFGLSCIDGANATSNGIINRGKFYIYDSAISGVFSSGVLSGAALINLRYIEIHNSSMLNGRFYVDFRGASAGSGYLGTIIDNVQYLNGGSQGNIMPFGDSDTPANNQDLTLSKVNIIDEGFSAVYFRNGYNKKLYLDDSFLANWNNVGWETTPVNTPDAELWRRYSYDITVKNSGGDNLQNVRVFITDLAGDVSYNNLTDTNGAIATQKLVNSYYTSYTGTTPQMKTPHYVKLRKYGYRFTGISKTISDTSKDIFVIDAKPFVVASEATAATYTGVSVDWANKLITVSGTRTIQELYDYLEYQSCQSSNIQYDEPLTTVDGKNFTLTNGWSINVTGSLYDVAKSISGIVAVSSGGFFEDMGGAKWDVSGTTYYAAHFYHTIKKNSDSSALAGAVLAYIDDSGNDRTYNTSKVVGGLISDENGNVEGYVVYKIGNTTYTGHKVYCGEYNHQWISIPKTINGTAIGSSSAKEDIRLVADTQVTLTKANALLVSGVSVDCATGELDFGGNSLMDVYDNLKARQTRVDAIDGTIKGYMSYCQYGQLLTKDGTTYIGISTFTYLDPASAETGTFKDLRLVFSTPDEYNFTLVNAIAEFAAVGSYDLRLANISGTFELVNTSGSTVMVQLFPTVTYTNTGPNITVEASTAVTITVGNIVAGSRLQIYNLDDNEEIVNQIIAGTSYSQNFTYTEDKNIRIRAMKISGASTAYKWYEITGTITVYGFNVNINQEINNVYITNGVDGSDVTECSISGTTLRIYVDDPDNTTTAQRIYNWFQYYLSTEAGIREQSNSIVATDSTHYVFSNSMKIVNQDTANPLNITGANIVPETGNSTDIFDLTNGASIALNFFRVEGFAYSTGGSVEGGLTEEQHDKLMSIPTAAQNRAEMDANSIKLKSILGEL